MHVYQDIEGQKEGGGRGIADFIQPGLNPLLVGVKIYSYRMFILNLIIN